MRGEATWGQRDTNGGLWDERSGDAESAWLAVEAFDGGCGRDGADQEERPDGDNS